MGFLSQVDGPNKMPQSERVHKERRGEGRRKKEGLFHGPTALDKKPEGSCSLALFARSK